MITILDGGMGQELVARSTQPPNEMWSAKVLMNEADLVTQVHADYIRAGADMITINAYSATPERLKQYGHGDKFLALQQAAIDCATKARDQLGRDVKITGCLPPLFASYNPDLNNDYDMALGLYSQIADAQTAGVDILLAETLGSLLEVRAAATALSGRGKPVWISMSLSEDTATPSLRSGEALEEALAFLAQQDVDAVLLNCSLPETISAAMPTLAQAKTPFGAYANGFTAIKKLEMGDIVAEKFSKRSDLTPQGYANFAQTWIDAGATLIGGCCEVGPVHITELSRRFGAHQE